MRYAVLVAFVVSMIHGIYADVIVLQNGANNYNGCTDSYLDSKSKGSNFGTANVLKYAVAG